MFQIITDMFFISEKKAIKMFYMYKTRRPEISIASNFSCRMQSCAFVYLIAIQLVLLHFTTIK